MMVETEEGAIVTEEEKRMNESGGVSPCRVCRRVTLAPYKKIGDGSFFCSFLCYNSFIIAKIRRSERNNKD